MGFWFCHRLGVFVSHDHWQLKILVIRRAYQAILPKNSTLRLDDVVHVFKCAGHNLTRR
jgi:hypothetical protein